MKLKNSIEIGGLVLSTVAYMATACMTVQKEISLAGMVYNIIIIFLLYLILLTVKAILDDIRADKTR